jgi:hypothetical protein
MILWYKDIQGKYRVFDRTPTGYWVEGRLAVPAWEPEFSVYLVRRKMSVKTFYKLFDHKAFSGLYVLKEGI